MFDLQGLIIWMSLSLLPNGRCGRTYPPIMPAFLIAQPFSQSTHPCHTERPGKDPPVL